MNMINTDNYLLGMQGIYYLLRKMNEKNYVLTRRFSELNVMLPRGSCAALNLNISLWSKRNKDKWNGIYLEQIKIGLRILFRIKDGTITVEIGVSV
jgi:hypothetical protein